MFSNWIRLVDCIDEYFAEFLGIFVVIKHHEVSFEACDFRLGGLWHVKVRIDYLGDLTATLHDLVLFIFPIEFGFKNV